MKEEAIIAPRELRIEDAGSGEFHRREVERNASIQLCAREWINVIERQEGRTPDFQTEAMPQALYDLMDAYSPDMVRVAVEKWLADFPKKKP